MRATRYLLFLVSMVLAATQNVVELVPPIVQTALEVGHSGAWAIAAVGTVVESGAALIVNVSAVAMSARPGSLVRIYLTDVELRDGSLLWIAAIGMSCRDPLSPTVIVAIRNLSSVNALVVVGPLALCTPRSVLYMHYITANVDGRLIIARDAMWLPAALRGMLLADEHLSTALFFTKLEAGNKAVMSMRSMSIARLGPPATNPTHLATALHMSDIHVSAGSTVQLLDGIVTAENRASTAQSLYAIILAWNVRGATCVVQNFRFAAISTGPCTSVVASLNASRDAVVSFGDVGMNTVTSASASSTTAMLLTGMITDASFALITRSYFQSAGRFCHLVAGRLDVLRGSAVVFEQIRLLGGCGDHIGMSVIMQISENSSAVLRRVDALLSGPAAYNGMFRTYPTSTNPIALFSVSSGSTVRIEACTCVVKFVYAPETALVSLSGGSTFVVVDTHFTSSTWLGAGVYSDLSSIAFVQCNTLGGASLLTYPFPGNSRSRVVACGACDVGAACAPFALGSVEVVEGGCNCSCPATAPRSTLLPSCGGPGDELRLQPSIVVNLAEHMELTSSPSVSLSSTLPPHHTRSTGTTHRTASSSMSARLSSISATGVVSDSRRTSVTQSVSASRSPDRSSLGHAGNTTLINRTNDFAITNATNTRIATSSLGKALVAVSLLEAVVAAVRAPASGSKGTTVSRSMGLALRCPHQDSPEATWDQYVFVGDGDRSLAVATTVGTQLAVLAFFVTSVRVANLARLRPAARALHVLFVSYYDPNVVGMCAWLVGSTRAGTAAAVFGLAVIAGVLGFAVTVVGWLWSPERTKDPKSFVRAHQAFFHDARDASQRWLRIHGVLDVGAACAMAAIASFPYEPPACRWASLALIAVSGAQLVYVVAGRPIASRTGMVSLLVLSAVNVVTAATCFAVANESLDDAALDVAGWIATAAFACDLGANVAMLVWSATDSWRSRKGCDHSNGCDAPLVTPLLDIVAMSPLTPSGVDTAPCDVPSFPVDAQVTNPLAWTPAT